MKTIFKLYLCETVALYLVSTLFSGISFESGYQTLLFAGAVLMVSTLVVKPVLNILLLPLNLVTFGFFKWVSSVVAIYIVTLLVTGFKISGFGFGGYTSRWFDIPSFNLSGILAFVAVSFAISVFASFIHWLLK